MWYAFGTVFEACAWISIVLAIGRLPAPPPASPNPWSEPTREILVQNCGTCHRGDLPDAVPRALRVYDLSHGSWYENLTSEQLGGLLQRVRGSSRIPEWDRFTVDRFVRCARDRECEVPVNAIAP